MKERIQKAVHDFIKSREPKDRPLKKNNDPENQLVKEIAVWLKRNGFSYNVIEAKATYSPTQKRYISSNVKAGVVDIIGNDSEGRGVFIEVKAPKKRGTLRDNQREFLIGKIKTNCFAVCVDSVDLLNYYYYEFLLIPDFRARQEFLLDNLPKVPKRRDDDKPLFED